MTTGTGSKGPALSHAQSRGYTLAEIAFTMPAALIVVLACIGSLHLSAKLLRDCTQPFAARTLAMLHLRRDFTSCVVIPTETANEFELYDRWGRKRSARQLVRETTRFAVLSFDIDALDTGDAIQSVNRVVALVRCSILGAVEQLQISARLASQYEAEFLEEYGQHTSP